MYFGAEHLIGFFTVIPSAQWYSYLGGRGGGRDKEERGRGREMGEKGEIKEGKGEERGKENGFCYNSYRSRGRG